MSFSFKRAVGALALLVIAFPGICDAAGSAPPPASPPVDSHHNNASDSTPPSAVTTFAFVRKNKLGCFNVPDAAPGAVAFDNEGPGTLTIGTKITVVLQPTGKIIIYVLPFEMPPMTGMILYGAYSPDSTTQVVTCTVTATPPKPRLGKPRL